MPFAPITAFDSFARSATVSSGWGTSTSDQAWAKSSSALSVSGNAARLNSGVNSALLVQYLNTGSGIAKQTYGTVLMRFKWTSSTAYALTDFGPALSYNTNNTFYAFTIQGNWANVAILCYINGVRWELNRTTTSLSQGAQYWVRFEVHSGGCRGKLWQVGTTEPTSWTLTSGLWDGATKPAAGYPALFNKGTRDAYDVYVYTYIYKSVADEYQTSISDTFVAGTESAAGLGTTTVGTRGDVWQGAVIDDPANATNYNALGYKSYASAYGVLDVPASRGEVAGTVGKALTGNVETFVKFQITPDTGTRFRVGLRGDLNYNNRIFMPRGYMAQFMPSTGKVTLYKRTSTTGAYTAIGTTYATGIPLPVTYGEIYCIRFRIKSNTLQARVWRNSKSEPWEWHAVATDTSLPSGSTYSRGWFAAYNGATSSKLFILRFFSYGAPAPDIAVPPPDPEPPPPPDDPDPLPPPPPPPEPNNFSTTGTLTATSTTDTSISFSYSYTHDENNNATVTVAIKPSTSSTWTNKWIAASPNRTTKTYANTIPSLAPNTTYNVRVTHNDADGVSGGNPVTMTVTTTKNAIGPTTVTISDVTASSMKVTSQYARGDANTSTASLSYRVSTNSVFMIEDSFVDEPDLTLLQNTKSRHNNPTAGISWENVVPYSGEAQAYTYLGRVYMASEADDGKMLYYHENAPTLVDFDVRWSMFRGNQGGILGVASHINPTTGNHTGVRVNFPAAEWEMYTHIDGVETILETYPYTATEAEIEEYTYVVRAAYRAVEKDGVELFRSTNVTYTSTPSYVGIVGKGRTQNTMGNNPMIDSFYLTERRSAQAWITAGSMTADRTAKSFTRTLTGLEGDTVYEVRVTFSDPAGVTGPNPLIGEATTTGRAAFLWKMGVTSSHTSAVLETFYKEDLNDNCFITVQYRSVLDTMWITVPYARTKAFRAAKRFNTTLAPLKPSLTYAIRVTLADPDGLMTTSVTELTGTFTTRGLEVGVDPRTKHYLWKVYDGNSKYKGTLKHTPDPTFKYFQNGGVADLSVNLPLSFNEIGIGTLIHFKHRIDIWGIDPSSMGMGENYVYNHECVSSVGGWVLGSNASYLSTAGPDGSSCLYLNATTNAEVETLSAPMVIAPQSPLVMTCMAKSLGGGTKIQLRSYNANDIALDMSDEVAQTVGTDWQMLTLEYEPPLETAYVRIVVKNNQKGKCWIDKFDLKSKEYLVYSGLIESYTPVIDENGESVDVEVLGLSTFLSDEYIEFMQFTDSPSLDNLSKPNQGATDPAEMFKRLIDEAKRKNPKFKIFYNDDSIRYTGKIAQYVFEDTELRTCLDKVLEFCPAGWHYYVEPNGLIHLRGEEHGTVHILRIGVEVMKFSVMRSIRNLKNYIVVKGREDPQKEEPDGFGTIRYVTFDQKSINTYNKRVYYIKDTSIADPETAQLVGDGRLDEFNREEQRAECYIPDEKSFSRVSGSLIGYDIESLRPGDLIIFRDPMASPRTTKWDQMVWEYDTWDITGTFAPLPQAVAIKTISYEGDHVTLELNERAPSHVGAFSKLQRWLAEKE